jgi:hypothetical protein
VSSGRVIGPCARGVHRERPRLDVRPALVRASGPGFRADDRTLVQIRLGSGSDLRFAVDERRGAAVEAALKCQGGHVQLKLNRRLLRLALAGTAALAAIAPASASASTSGGLLGGTLKRVTDVASSAVSAVTTQCESSDPVARTFSRWLDPAFYKAAPGGDFEPGSPGWTLARGARIVPGNATQHVGGAGDGYSLELPAGASATSPASCVGLVEPTFRMFASGPLTGVVLAQAVYGSIGVPAGVATGGAWAPTLPMLTGVGLPSRSFSIRLTNIGLGTMRIDDVYIDPYRRG